MLNAFFHAWGPLFLIAVLATSIDHLKTDLFASRSFDEDA